MSIITLTTDFGLRDCYVAQMKGIILGIDPDARIVDVTHEIPPQDIFRGAIVMEQIVPAFSPGTIHVGVIDPGVGSNRPLLAVEAAGQRFLVPDNGLLTRVVRRWTPSSVRRLTERRFFCKEISKTFHGRDILAPVAAWWSRETSSSEFGPVWEQPLVMLKIRNPEPIEGGVQGQVEGIDSFGNLLTNLEGRHLPPGPPERLIVEAGDLKLQGISQSYSDGYPGEILALFGSGGKLEIAVNAGNAARQLSIPVGSLVRVLSPPSS